MWTRRTEDDKLRARSVRSKDHWRRPPERHAGPASLPSQSPRQAVACNDKRSRIVVAHQDNCAPVDDWRTCHSIEVLKGAQPGSPTHLPVVVVRHQSNFGEEDYNAGLIGCGSWRCRIIRLECDLHTIAPDFAAP